jgi:hypothetical protein
MARGRYPQPSGPESGKSGERQTKSSRERAGSKASIAAYGRHTTTQRAAYNTAYAGAKMPRSVRGKRAYEMRHRAGARAASMA